MVPSATAWCLIRWFIPVTENSIDREPDSSSGTARRHFVATGSLPDGREWGVQRRLLGRCLLQVWRPDLHDPEVPDDGWEYDNKTTAVLSAFFWDGDEPEPRWWRRHPGSGRTRDYRSDGTYRERLDP